MEGVTSLLLIGSLNYDFGGSRTKTEKKSSKTSISDWDMDVQGPGFEQVLDTFWGSFLKNVAKTSRSDKVLSAGGGWGQIGESGLAWGRTHSRLVTI